MKKRILKWQGAKVTGLEFVAGWNMTASQTTSGKKAYPKRPKKPVHPGEVLLEEFIIPMKKTRTALAADLGWPRAKMGAILKGQRRIEAESALDLAEALGTTPELWMHLQVMWDLDRVRKVRKD